MSTLAEIERAADELPAPQVEQLIEYLAARLRRERAGKARKHTNLAEFSGALHLTEDPLARQRRLRAKFPLVHCAPGVRIESTKEQIGYF